MPVKVFISYSQESAEHKDRVWDFAARLRKDGVESWIDQYEDCPVVGWSLWCEKQIRDSDFVLITCTETYLRRMQKEETPGKGFGVAWEAEIIRNDIYRNGCNSTKYIPIVFSDTDFLYIPLPLQGTTRYNVSTQEGYQSIVLRLNGHKPFVPPVAEVNPIPIPERKTGYTCLWSVPYPKNPFFSGREKELANLHAALTRQNTVAVNQAQAVCGLGGIGKTQLALEYAYRYRTEYNAVFWVSADTADAIESGFLSIAHYLNLPQKANPDRKIVLNAVLRWIAQSYGWLLIFDNADTPGLLTEYIPAEHTGRVLLTSRAHTFDELGLTAPLELEKMDPKEACAFLRKRTGKENATQEELKLISRLCTELDYLPLALEQAGAYILKTQCSFEKYLAAFTAIGVKVLEKAKPIAGKYPRSVETTWALNFKEVEKQSKASADALRVCAFLYPDKIPLEIFEQGGSQLGEPIAAELSALATNPLLQDDLLEPLLQFSLVKRNAESQTIDIHRLVQAVLQDKMDEEEKKLWAKRIVNAVNKVFPNPEFKNWSLCVRLLSHTKRCAVHIDVWNLEDADTGRFLNEIGVFLDSQGQYAEAEPLFQRSLVIREKVLGCEHPDVAQSLNNLAGVYDSQGLYGVAEPLYERALTIYEKAFGSDHQDVATSLNNLAELFRTQDNYAKAEPLYLRSLMIREKVLGSDHQDVAQSLNNLAILYFQQRLYIKAESLYQRSLAIREKVFGSDHPDVANSLNNLASLYTNQGRYAEAELLYQRSLIIWKKALGSGHPDVANSLNNIAFLYRLQGRYIESESLYQRSLAIRQKFLGCDHPDVAQSLNNLAELNRIQGKYTEAEPLYLQSLAIWEKIIGSNHSNAAKTFNNLAELYRLQGRYAEAETLYKHSLAITEKVFSTEHPNVANSLNNLALFYKKQKRYAEAKSLYQRSLRIRKKIFGTDHPDIAASLYNLAGLYHVQGRYTEAEPLYQRSLAIREKTLGSDHSGVAASLNNLAVLFYNQGRYAEAEPLFQNSLAIREKVLGSDHPDTVAVRNNLTALNKKRKADIALDKP